MTAQLPAASSGARIIADTDEFDGLITPTTPYGSWRMKSNEPSGVGTTEPAALSTQPA